jgi:hypothetical protein
VLAPHRAALRAQGPSGTAIKPPAFGKQDPAAFRMRAEFGRLARGRLPDAMKPCTRSLRPVGFVPPASALSKRNAILGSCNGRRIGAIGRRSARLGASVGPGARPPHLRTWGIVLGTGVAVVLGIIFAGAITVLLGLPWLKLIGLLFAGQ